MFAVENLRVIGANLPRDLFQPLERIAQALDALPDGVAQLGNATVIERRALGVARQHAHDGIDSLPAAFDALPRAAEIRAHVTSGIKALDLALDRTPATSTLVPDEATHLVSHAAGELEWLIKAVSAHHRYGV